MGKLNNAAITGFLLCFIAIIFGIVTNGGTAAVLNLIHIPSFIVTFGGALFAVLMTADSFTDFQEGLISFTTAFRQQGVSVYELTEQIFSLSETSRKEGLLALEEEANKIEFDFLKKAITLVVDGSDPELVQDILESEMIHNEELLIMEVVTEGVLSIQAGENTRIIREKIKSVIEMETKEEDNA